MPRKYFSKNKRTVDQLLSALQSENFADRRDAARELGYRGDLSAVEPLIYALNNTVSQDRHQIILSLGILGDRRAIEPLTRTFSNPNDAFVSANALSRIKSQKVVKLFIAGLKSDNRVIRLSAALFLGEIGNQQAVEPLIDALGDENNSVRNYAAVSLGKLKDKRAIKPLLAILKDVDLETPKSTNLTIELSNADVQASATIALGNLGAKGAIKPILKLLTCKNRDLIESTVLALGDLRAKVATKALLEILNNHDKANFARHFAAMALGKIGDKRAFDPLISSLSDEDVVVRIAAADGLGHLGDSRAIPILKLARKNDNGSDEFGRRVRDHATSAIGRIQKKK